MAWHSDPVDEVFQQLDTSEDGLDSEEVEKRLGKYGENSITDESGVSALEILVDQFRDFLIWILLAAALLSFWAGHTVDTVLITLIVLANGVFGFVQDYKAEKSIQALKKLASPDATVIRSGETTEVPSEKIVPGDILVLEPGDSIPADARIFESSNLHADESALTGESVPVQKDTGAVDENTPLAERGSMVFKQTTVTKGRGKAVVVKTGMDTQVGSIAEDLQSAEDHDTPFQQEVDTLGKKLGGGVLALSALIVPVLVLLKDTPLLEAVLTAVSLAVAAVPEGLPAVVTLTLALGTRLMADENALVRRLPVVESLGSVDVVCTDKTGTLTEDRMSVTSLWVPGHEFSIEDMPEDHRLGKMLGIGAICNNASLERGEPTEKALVESAEKYGIDHGELREEDPREDEIGFTSERKRMTTVNENGVYMKGAPEVVLEHCDRYLSADGVKELDEETREKVREKNEEFASDALRVLGFAYKDEKEDPEENLIFVGLQGMIDPPREEVKKAIEETMKAGVDVKMITGDNRVTAKAIAEQVGLESEVIEGREIEDMSDGELRERLEEVSIFARVAPEHKVRITEALQAKGDVVAMTGDGVNDAPALKNADVGIAMGERGTDVAKQTSDLILLDDNFETIRDAIKRGRIIFDNIWKFVTYLLSANLTEVLLVFIASLYGYLILPAVQLLWINLLTDGLPALALGADPESGDVMEREPREKDRGIIDGEMLSVIGSMGVTMTAMLLILMFHAVGDAGQVTSYAMTMVFTGLVIFEFQRIYIVRWLKDTSPFSNIWLFTAVAVSLLLHMAILYTPLNAYFGTVPLGLMDWGVLLLVVGAGIPVSIGAASLVKGRFE